MNLPDLEVHKPAHEQLEPNITVYSKITEIYYKIVKGKLMKFGTYSNADIGWKQSMYMGSFKHMKQVSDEKAKKLR